MVNGDTQKDLKRGDPMKSFKNTFRFSSAAALVLVLQSLLLAEAPQEIHYQGKLTGTDGTPVSNGSYALTFRICGDNPGSGSCLSLWETTLPTVSVNAGVFSVTLTGLPASVFQGGVDRWLELTYGGSTFMPRQKLVAAPYALAVATDSVGNDELKSNSVNSAKIVNNSIKNEDLSPTAGIQATKIDFSPGVAVGTLLSGDEKLAVSGDVRLEGLLTVGVGGTAIKKFISAEGTLSNPFMVPPNSTSTTAITTRKRPVRVR
jgi:hypothetical protein